MPEISAKKLASLLQAGDQAKTEISSISGEFGERIKESVEKDSLHSGAFRAILKLKRADEEKRDEFLRHFDRLRDMCDEHHLWGETHTGDIADMAEAGIESARPIGEVVADVVKSNVATLRGGIRHLLNEGPSDYAKGERVPAAARRPGPAPQKAGHTFGVANEDPLADSAAE